MTTKRPPEIPERLNVAWYLCDEWAKKNPQAPALFSEDLVVSKSELLRLVNRAGNALLSLQIRKGDRVVFRSQNSVELYTAMLACMKIGAVPIPTSTLFRASELGYILSNSRAVAALVEQGVHEPFLEVSKDSKYLKHVVSLGERISADSVSLSEIASKSPDELECAETSKRDEAFILYTSGTTGNPKGVVHANAWLIGAGEPVATQQMQLEPGDVTLSVSEIAWMYPFGCNFVFPLYAGAAACIYRGRFIPERAFEFIQRFRATHFIANPTIYKRMLLISDAEKRWDCSSLKMGLSSGETLSPDVFKSWKSRFNCEIYDSMGQSEIHIFCCTRPGVVKLASMGKPLETPYDVKVLDQDGRECNAEEIGSLAIRKDHTGLALRYENMEEEWRSKIRGDWYYTGDLAYSDNEGFFFFVSRNDDLIKSRGYLISPKEVEDRLQEHEAVLEAGVVGVHDPVLGQRVKAFVVLRPGFRASGKLADEIREMTLRTMAPFKAPKDIEFVDSLPKTVTGKVLRRELRKT